MDGGMQADASEVAGGAWQAPCVRLLAFADEPPPADAAELVAGNAPAAVVTLGDLRRSWIASLGGLTLPCLGVHGNHDADDELAAIGVRDLHLDRVEIDGWSFAGFEGCVRYGTGPHQYTQEEAGALAERLPAADVLLCHCPPHRVNDEPDDPAHVGFVALRAWVERHRPRYVLHGHTTPDPRARTTRLGDTEVVWVRGARVVELRP
jgi:Icc-related predicted phosphoesterase